MSTPRTRIGIIGYGSLGVYLARFVLSAEGAALGLELAFVWNRSPEAVTSDATVAAVALADLADAPSRGATLLVEVCHPLVVRASIASWLSYADVMVGSLTAFADDATLSAMRNAIATHGRRCFLPAGAFWGAADVQKMSRAGSLRKLRVTMAKNPSAFHKLEAPLRSRLDAAPPGDAPFTIFEGSVREISPLAPNNVNTMACAALAAIESLGFDGTEAVLVSDPSLAAHIVDIYAEGPNGFTLHIVRTNPAAQGAVTGNATYQSFASSLTIAAAGGKLNPEMHFC